MVSPISIKNDLVLSYIEALPVGAKISVRRLASELNVSEGTVYKAIKDAEVRGLVVTRPKAGTFRIDTAVPEADYNFTIADVAKLLGLSLAAGKSVSSRTIRRVIVCDSDEAQLKRKLETGALPQNTLCIAGNRPTLHQIAIDAGANLLVTDGNRATDYLLSQAEKQGVCVMGSLQSTYTLLRLLDTQFTAETQQPEADGAVYEWMQTPDYLYYNDIVADWHRFYQHYLSGMNQYPIVDDELNIFGGLEINRAFAAMPSQKLSGITAPEEIFLRVDKRDSLHNVAKQMILSDTNLAAVIDGGRMEGIITANDLLRYYMYAESSSAQFQVEPFLEAVTDASSHAQMLYRLRIPEKNEKSIPNLEMAIMLAAAGRHVECNGCTDYKIDSGTFYAPNRVIFSDGLMLTSTLAHSGDNYVIEVEIHDDTQSFAKALLIFSPLTN